MFYLVRIFKWYFNNNLKMRFFFICIVVMCAIIMLKMCILLYVNTNFWQINPKNWNSSCISLGTYNNNNNKNILNRYLTSIMYILWTIHNKNTIKYLKWLNHCIQYKYHLMWIFNLFLDHNWIIIKRKLIFADTRLLLRVLFNLLNRKIINRNNLYP